jgi:broad specificity phosphatase PhoE
MLRSSTPALRAATLTRSSRSLAAWLVAASMAGLLAAPTPLRAQVAVAKDARRATATTVLLVRHAEKAAEPAADPPLTPDGEARAQALVTVARDAGVTAIVTTQFQRTRLTAAPLAQALGITAEVVNARGTDHPREVARLVLERHAGETVLVVGHSNTIPDIVAALGAPHPGVIADSTHDNLFIVTVPAEGKARLVRARYGRP